MKKYSWDFDEHAERWYNDSEATIDDCIAAAEAENADSSFEHNTVYVGKNVAFTPMIDSESVLEQIQEQAYEFAGEVGGDWNAYDYKKRDELDELDEKLTAVLHEWLKKYGYYPEFYAIENILPYKLNCMEGEE